MECSQKFSCLNRRSFFNSSIHPLNDDLYTGRYDDNGYNDESDTHSEDSNSEGHWRNEYPDEDEDGNGSISESDMIRAVNNLDIGMLIFYFIKTVDLFKNIDFSFL